MRTFTPKPGDVERSWYVIDATDVVLGRLASQAAQLLRGKHKPVFAPHVDAGDFVIIINADKVALTGAKLEKKRAYRHSGYPGGLKSVNYAELLATRPERAVEKAVAGMGPEDSSRTCPDAEAEGLCRCRAPARRSESAAVRTQPGRAVSA